jgi:hypothetical protein
VVRLDAKLNRRAADAAPDAGDRFVAVITDNLYFGPVIYFRIQRMF